MINFKKVVAYLKKMFYSNKRCDMIAMKREVAAFIQLSRFSVERMSGPAIKAKQTDDKSLYSKYESAD